MKVVILAGGPGSRLWPLSTSDRPKQFLPLLGGQSLLQYTYNLMLEIFSPSDIFVQTLSGLESHVFNQLPGLKQGHLLLTPTPKDNYPDVLWATNHLGADPDEPILFKSVDLFIPNPQAFLDSLVDAIETYLSAKPAITLLCTPVTEYNPNSGFLIADESRSVIGFIEKPSAQEFESLMSGSTVYRSLFTFILSKNTLLNAHASLENEWAESGRTFLTAPKSAWHDLFLSLPPVSISRTVFQHAKDIKVDSIREPSSDFGTYSALYASGAKDEHGNVAVGEVVLDDNCSNNLVLNHTDSPLIVASVCDSVVVKSSRGIIISNFADASRVGEISKQLPKS